MWNRESLDNIRANAQTSGKIDFRNVRFSGKNIPTTCGEYQVDGDANWDRFVGHGSTGFVLEGEVEAEIFQLAWESDSS